MNTPKIEDRFNGFITNHVKPLLLPFVQGSNLSNSAQQIEIVREPATVAELKTSPLGASREFNKANIRILLADNPVALHPDGSAQDVDDVDLTGGGAGLRFQSLPRARQSAPPPWPGRRQDYPPMRQDGPHHLASRPRPPTDGL